MNKVNELMRQGCRVYKMPYMTRKELRSLEEVLSLHMMYDKESGLLYVKTNYNG